MHQSVCTIDAPEFINLQPLDINPMMSECEIKVMYIGENRNRSFISKDVAAEMAKTLRGAPIVGYFKQEKEDFVDHGEKVVIDGDGVHFSCETRPYGFVAPNADVWFQKFDEQDAFGNSIQREYLMTTGFLWTGQYEECKIAVEGEGRPHSMEIDPDTLQGSWSKNYNTGMEFYIINDAVFSKLCILGEDVEPCFEGSKVSSPEVSKNFSLDGDFKQTLYTMMQDLNAALEGGKTMENKNVSVIEEEVKTDFSQEQEVESEFVSSKKDEEKEDDKKESSEDTADKESDSSDKKEDEDEKKKENFACKDDDEKKKFVKEDEEDKKEEDEEKKPESKHELAEEPAAEEPVVEFKVEESKEYIELKAQYDELQSNYSLLEEQVESLKAFKYEVETKQKDELIDSFYMLEEADKAEVIANKDKFTLDEIKKELSVICFDKKVSFTLEENKGETPEVTFDVIDTDSTLPAWVKAVKDNEI